MCLLARFLFPALLFPAFLSVHGQTAPAGDPFAAESFVIQREDSIYSYNADGTGFREVTLAVTVQSEAALRNFSVVGVAFAANSEKVEFRYVRVHRRDGSVVQTPLSDAIEQPTEVTREAPFYSDLKQEQIPVRSLGVGDTLEWQARVVRTHAEAPGEFWGQESFTAPGDAVARVASVVLRFPMSKAVTVWTDPRFLKTEGAKPPTDTTAGEERIVRWESSTLKPTAGPAAEADKEARKKHVLSADEELDAEQGKLPSIAWTTFPTWSAVGAWYRGLQGDRTSPTPEIKARVAELTAGKTSEEDKIRAVYAFASSQIRYIGVAFGIGRYQPHRAEDVLSNQYGDCKDKETLLASMLAVLGLHTDAVLIGAGIRFNAAVPSPGAFNHLIARVELPGEPVFLDPTTEVAPYRALLAPLRDHEALVIADSGAATVQRTPATLPFAADQEWQAVGTLSAAGVTQSHIVVTFRGDDELVVRSVLRQVPPSSYDELGQRLIASLGFGGTVSHAEFSRPDDTVEPLRFSFDYKRDISSNWDHRIVAQLAPITLPTIDDKDPPTAALNLATLRTEHSTAAITVPEGWRAELPEAIHAKSPWATVDLTYRFDKGTVYTERTLKVLQHKVPASDWPAYKKFQDAANLGLENYISLTHFTTPGKRSDLELPLHERTVPSASSAKNEIRIAPHDSVKIAKSNHAPDAEPAAPAAAPEPPAASAAEADRFIQQGSEAAMQFDLAAATSLLDRARAFSADRPHLWAAYGMVAAAMGKPIEANADFHKELAAHPDELQVYGAIAQTELSQGHRPAAEAALRAWTAADASADKAALQLADMLLKDGKAADAVKVASATVATLTDPTRDNPPLQLILGKAQLKAGQRDAGDKTLTALLRASDDPGMLNDAAYELADAQLEFPLAEQSSRTAISKLTEETKSWTLDESPQTLQARTSLLIAAWDTMGWILYREGKPREAQPWLAAAWLNGQHPAVHDHLVEVQRALGPAFVHSAEAIDTDKNEQTVRTLPLGKAEGRNGVGQYRVLLAADKVERVEPNPDGKPLPDGDALIKTARLPHFFPPGSEARIVRSALLNCHSGTCELVFVP